MKVNQSTLKILILTNDHLYANIAVKEFLKQYCDRIVGLILPDFIIPNKSFLASVIFLAKKSFWQFLMYKWFEEKIYQLKTSFGWGKLKPLTHYAKQYGFPLLKTQDINNPKTIRLIKHLKPDVIYSLAFPQKIKHQVFNLAKRGCINFHDSLLPRYRGLCAYFWVVANNEPETGVTANLIDRELDTGKIIMLRKFRVRSSDTMQQIYYKSVQLMGVMITKIQKRLDADKINFRQQPKTGSSYYSWPDKKGYQLFKSHKKRFFKFNELWQSI